MKRFCSFVFSVAIGLLFLSNAYAEPGRWFINGGAYSGKTGIETTGVIMGESLAKEESDESGTGLVLSIGSINETQMASIEVSTLEYTEASVLSVLAVYDRFIGGNDMLKPYVGVHGGYASMTWKEDIGPFKIKDETASSGALGARAGLVVRLNDFFMIDMGYKYTATALETDLIVNSANKTKIESKYNHGGYLTLNCLF